MARAFAYRSALLKAREQSSSDCTARGSHGSSSAIGATLNLWTTAGGLKPNVAADSSTYELTSSSDGARIAFTFDTTEETTALAVTTPEAPSTTANATTAVITGMNIASPCVTNFRFVKRTLFSTHCAGARTTLTGASLVTVPDVPSPTPKTLVNGDVPADALVSRWEADESGTKVFVVGGPAAEGRVVTVADGAIAHIETGTNRGFLSGDGSTVFYRTTASAFKRAPATDAPTPVVLIASGYAGTSRRASRSPDGKHIFFRSLDGRDDGAMDLKLADLTTAGQSPIDLVATPTGLPAGWTATSSHAVYLTDLPPRTGLRSSFSGKLKVRPAAGGAEREIAVGADAPWMLSTGTKGIFTDNEVATPLPIADLKIFDATSGSATLLASGVSNWAPSEEETTLVYTKPGAEGGLYTVDIR